MKRILTHHSGYKTRILYRYKDGRYKVRFIDRLKNTINDKIYDMFGRAFSAVNFKSEV